MKKIALITGVTSGIGKACARKFAEGGYNLILTGRKENKLKEVCEQIEKATGVRTLSLCFDVRDRKAAQEAIGSLPEEWQNIDVLINNAGLALGLEKEYEGDVDDWETMVNTNILGLLYMRESLCRAWWSERKVT